MIELIYDAPEVDVAVLDRILTKKKRLTKQRCDESGKITIVGDYLGPSKLEKEGRITILLVTEDKKDDIDDAVNNYSSYVDDEIKKEITEENELRQLVWYAQVAGQDLTKPLPLIVKAPFGAETVEINVGVTTKIRDLAQANQLKINDWVVGVYGSNIGKPIAVDKILKTW